MPELPIANPNIRQHFAGIISISQRVGHAACNLFLNIMVVGHPTQVQVAIYKFSTVVKWTASIIAKWKASRKCANLREIR
jgi:hypothetical protein